ncbi:MAG: hypothetical protein HC890_17800 [Chloroflexaceae bacterium]|nr:hypothetical protein [Chloroflexaceae bacterium]
MPYTTQDLIEILETELRAVWKGERIVLSSADRIAHPAIAKALNLQKVSKVFAYQDFRRQVHEYQQQHRVSAIIWRETTFADRRLRYPELHNQLLPIPGDKAILMSAKASVLAFWQEATPGMNFWQSDRRPITPQILTNLAEQAEWAELDAGRSELYLGLCWGNPQEYLYQWARPHSGCDRIIATHHWPSAIKV